MKIHLPLHFLKRALAILVVGVSLCGLAVELAHAFAGLPSDSRLMILFDLSYEANFPTWVSSCLLFSCAVGLGFIAIGKRQSGAPFVAHWALLAAVFLYISLDELAQIHEGLNNTFQLGGAFYFDWIIPAGILVAILGIYNLSFLAHLPRRRRVQFIVAGAIYVCGALVLEVPLGYWTGSYGDDNLGYGLIDWVEESMELAGTSLFFLALLEELAEPDGKISIRLASDAAGSSLPAEARPPRQATPVVKRSRRMSARGTAVS